jgi:transcription-repair coupling factor (superfamily II helicase)
MENNKKTLHTAVDAVGTARSGLKITGLLGSSVRYLAALAAGRLDRPILFVTTEKRFDTVVEDLEFYIRDVSTGHTLITFPSWGFAPYERLVPQPDTAVTRIKTLRAMADGGGHFVLVVSASALMTRVISARSLSIMQCVIETGKEHARESIIRFLLQAGYTQASIVVTPGSFSVRGGILDYFTPDRTSPVRVEFYGDLIESIREFNPMTQRSIRDLMSCEIIPASELVLNDDAVKKGIRWFR